MTRALLRRFTLSFLFAGLWSIPLLAKPVIWSALPPNQEAEIKTKFPTMGTTSPSLEEFDKVLRYLMSKGSYEDLEVIEEDAHFLLKTKILKTINRIVFQGMKSFDANDLKPLLQIESGQKFDSRILYETREKIKSFYIDQGYMNASVDISVNEVPEDMIDLFIRVNEGDPIRIKSIQITCPNKELLSRLNRVIKRNIGKIYQPQIVAAIPKQIQGYFNDHRYLRATLTGPEIHMSPSKEGVDLTYHTERTEQYSVNFEGNHLIPTPRLISALELNTLTSVNPNILPDLMTRLKEFYWKKGYARVDIKGQEMVIETDVRSKLLFQITEGTPIKIDNMEFQGNLNHEEKYYKSSLSEVSGETVAKGLFHRNDFESGLKNLIAELQNEGYLKAKLISSRYMYNKDKTRITISVNLDEGPLTRIQEINFQGLQQLDALAFQKILGVSEGQPLKLQALEQGILELKTYAQEKGFLEFRILNEKENLVTYNDDNTLAKLNFQIEEGPQVKVATILIDGNTLTKEYVFRQEIEFKEGDLLTPSKIEESTRRLQKLSLFTSVEIKTLEQRTQIADRTVIIKVAERAPGLFNLGAGVTNEREFTLRGFAGLAYRNMNGTGRAFSTRAEINYNVADIQFPELKLTAGYLEPYILNSRTKGRVNFTRAIQVVDYDKRTGTDSYQLDFLLERHISSHILFTYDLWNISQLRDFQIDHNVAFSNFGLTKSLLNLASTGPGIEIDYRDHPFNPSKGHISRFNLEYSNPFLGNTRSIEYIKTTGSFTYYIPFKAPNPIVFANSLRVGDLKNLSGADGVPFDKKGFVLGGISTIRGFEAGTSERFPNDSDLQIGAGESYLLKDRSQFFLVKSEMRFPLWGSVGGAVFYDGGMVTVDDIKLKDPYRDAAGFGLRYATPVGPANIEFAWKLDTDKSRGESPFRLHISIGTF